MDGQVQAIRQALDAAGFKDTAIMSYCEVRLFLYGLFREAAGSALKGDRKSYQMNPMSRREAIRESLLDEARGRDLLWLHLPERTSRSCASCVNVLNCRLARIR
ncbi:hypothetical protein ACLK17_01710 [Escherichia coli]